MTTQEKASILIPCYERPGLLHCHLQTLEQQEMPSYEIIVLNDGPMDATETVCKAHNSLKIRYYYTGPGKVDRLWRIPGFAFNIGAQLARGEYLILTCPEMILLENDTIKLMVEALDQDPKRMVITDGRHDGNAMVRASFEQRGVNFDKSLYGSKALTPLTTTYPFYMAISKSEFFEIGGYDEDFVGVAYDDNDIVDRLQGNGCYYHKLDRRVIHMFHPTHHSVDRWLINERLYHQRKGIIKRNVGKNWGKYDP